MAEEKGMTELDRIAEEITALLKGRFPERKAGHDPVLSE